MGVSILPDGVVGVSVRVRALLKGAVVFLIFSHWSQQHCQAASFDETHTCVHIYDGMRVRANEGHS